MIDDIGKTIALAAKIQAALPMAAIATKELRGFLQQQSNIVFPRECDITEIRDMNDDGGIACQLDFGFSGPKNLYVVSITHLRFDSGNSLRREIEAYCKHRIKRLKKLNRGMDSI